jgi:hypothetical protein
MNKPSPSLWRQLQTVLRELTRDTLQTCITLFKIIIPISIATRFLQQWGMIDHLGVLLGPVMNLVGLPGEIGLVWATAMVTNLYAGMVVFASIAPGLDLSIAQVTVLTTMMLVAHGLPVELRIAQKAGTRFRTQALLRVGGALLLGALLNLGYDMTDRLQQTNQSMWNPPAVDPSWLGWGVSELKNFGSIVLIIFSLMSLLRLLKKIGVVDLLTRILEPVLALLGMGRQAAPLTIVGITLGLSYGGGLIIQEAQSGRLSKQEVFSSIALMGLCHSLIEDSLLMMVLGGHVSGVFWGRLIFSLLVVFLLVRLIRVLPQSVFERYFVRPAPVKSAPQDGEIRCC